MSKRYTYSRMLSSIEGVETFTATEFDSFEEAKTAVDKGIRDRKIELEKQYPDNNLAGGILSRPNPSTVVGPFPAAQTQNNPSQDQKNNGPR